MVIINMGTTRQSTTLSIHRQVVLAVLPKHDEPLKDTKTCTESVVDLADKTPFMVEVQSSEARLLNVSSCVEYGVRRQSARASCSGYVPF